MQFTAVAVGSAWLSIAIAWGCRWVDIRNSYLADVLILTTLLFFIVPRLVPCSRVDASFVFLTFLFAPFGSAVFGDHSPSALILFLTLLSGIAFAYWFQIKM